MPGFGCRGCQITVQGTKTVPNVHGKVAILCRYYLQPQAAAFRSICTPLLIAGPCPAYSDSCLACRRQVRQCVGFESVCDCVVVHSLTHQRSNRCHLRSAPKACSWACCCGDVRGTTTAASVAAVSSLTPTYKHVFCHAIPILPEQAIPPHSHPAAGCFVFVAAAVDNNCWPYLRACARVVPLAVWWHAGQCMSQHAVLQVLMACSGVLFGPT